MGGLVVLPGDSAVGRELGRGLRRRRFLAAVRWSRPGGGAEGGPAARRRKAPEPFLGSGALRRSGRRLAL